METVVPLPWTISIFSHVPKYPSLYMYLLAMSFYMHLHASWVYFMTDILLKARQLINYLIETRLPQCLRDITQYCLLDQCVLELTPIQHTLSSRFWVSMGLPQELMSAAYIIASRAHYLYVTLKNCLFAGQSYIT